MRFALEHQNPLAAGFITSGHAYPEKQFSLISTSDPDLLLWAPRPSEEGIAEGIAARFSNMSEKPGEFSVQLNGGVQQAWNLTHLETETVPTALDSGVGRE